MPVTHPPPEHPHPAKYRQYRDAARDNLLIVMKCGGCNRTVYFLASDLEGIVGGEHYAHVPPFECSRCRTTEYVMMTIHNLGGRRHYRLRLARLRPQARAGLRHRL